MSMSSPKKKLCGWFLPLQTVLMHVVFVVTTSALGPYVASVCLNLFAAKFTLKPTQMQKFVNYDSYVVFVLVNRTTSVLLLILTQNPTTSCCKFSLWGCFCGISFDIRCCAHVIRANFMPLCDARHLRRGVPTSGIINKGWIAIPLKEF